MWKTTKLVQYLFTQADLSCINPIVCNEEPCVCVFFCLGVWKIGRHRFAHV